MGNKLLCPGCLKVANSSDQLEGESTPEIDNGLETCETPSDTDNIDDSPATSASVPADPTTGHAMSSERDVESVSSPVLDHGSLDIHTENDSAVADELLAKEPIS